MSIMRSSGGLPRRMRWRAPVIMAVAAVIAFPATSLAAGKGGGGGGGGGGGEETTIGNNLSFPTIWSDGVQLALRGTFGAPQLQVPFTKTDADGNLLTLYLQAVEQNTWQAENTIATAPVDVSQVDWGDNIESRSLPLSKPIRVETTLLEDLTTPMIGFNMFSASGSKNTEVFGTDGTTYAGTQAAIYSGCARLTIQRLEISRNDPYVSYLTWDAASGAWTGKGMISEPLFNGGVWAGGEGTGYSAEINGSGKVVYGYNWTTGGLTAGDYRLTFSLDPNCPAATLNTFMTPATTVYSTTEAAALLPAAGGPGGGGSGETGGGAVAKIDATDNLSYIDVELGSPSYEPYVPPKPTNTVPPTISGTATQGQVLTASTGTWDNAPSSYSYQWQSCDTTGASCTPLSGATTASYTLTAADVGHTMRVVVTATNVNGDASATSAATTVVTPLAPVNTTLPLILGSAQVGHVLMATNGLWDNGPTGYTYQWQLCDAVTGAVCSDIAGANAGGFTLTDAFSGSRVRVIVTATNAGGSTAAASAPTQVITTPLVTPQQQQQRTRARITLQLRWLDGNRLHLWGTVAPARNGTWLTLQLKTRTGWKTAARVLLRTRDQLSSQYSVTLPGMAPGVYRAYIGGDTTYLDANSAQVRVRAQAHATLRVRHLHGLLKLTGTVSPARNGKHLMIQVRTRNGWRKVATVHLRTANRQRSQFTFSVASLKPGVYRAYYGGDSLCRAGGSGLVTIR